jgi:hypothetical protein
MNLHVRAAITKLSGVSLRPLWYHTAIEKLQVQLLRGHIADHRAVSLDPSATNADRNGSPVCDFDFIHMRTEFECAAMIAYCFHQGVGKTCATSSGDRHSAQLQRDGHHFVHEP